MFYDCYGNRAELEVAKQIIRDTLQRDPNAPIVPPPEPSIWNGYAPPIHSPTTAPATRSPLAVVHGPRLPEGYRLSGSTLPNSVTSVQTSEEQDRTTLNTPASMNTTTPASITLNTPAHNPAYGVRPVNYVEPPMLPRPLPAPPIFDPAAFPARTIEEVIHSFKSLMQRSSAGWTPEFGIGLPRDHIGTLKEFDHQWVLNRKAAEKVRNEMQGQLLASVMQSRKALQKHTTNNDRNVIHMLAPISFDDKARIVDIRAGSAFWGRSLAYTHSRAQVFSADEYHRMDERELQKSSSQRIIVPMDVSLSWNNMPSHVHLIRIGDGICHFPDKVALFGLIHERLLPGGFLELQFLEPIVRNNNDGDVATNNPLNMLFQLLCGDAPEDLRDFSGSAVAKVALEGAGFEDVEISRSRAFIGPYASGTSYDRAAASLLREALSRYAGHIGDMPLRLARGMMQREAAALLQHVRETLSQTGRFHMRFVCIVARKAERA
ncbi:hypothetical protein F5X68DRAFT_229364 [Plectosphaerella plurivora]|uniref:Methyltransferase domain-containing protein n=1 Tax=Plectosphaerella plurivora TaxID=936078 RepID=A0A9P8VI01_9PEZI|nr:hypothetical protein F5X68DRAFT_229364 [Plectosphaerella plurivora]